MYQPAVGLSINNPPTFQFHYKFEFILWKNWGTSYKDIKLATISRRLSSLKLFSLEQFLIEEFILLYKC